MDRDWPVFVDGVLSPWGKHVPQNIPAYPPETSTLEVGNPVYVPETSALVVPFSPSVETRKEIVPDVGTGGSSRRPWC